MGESLRHEFFGTNIRVINIHPGMVETEFSKVRFGGDEKKAKSIYEGMSPLTPDDIAYQVLNALKAPRHVNMDDIYILAREQIGVEKVFRKND
jgi:NADP-dependent 3-hydroxy acid dehydrogenase YdfG